MVAKGKDGRRGIDWEFEVGRFKVLCFEWINSRVLLSSTKNYIQSPGIKYNRNGYLKKNVYTYIHIYIYICIYI